MCWVGPDYIKQGVAGGLVSAIEDWRKERELSHIELNYIVGNTEAGAVWERLGYKPFRITSRKSLNPGSLQGLFVLIFSMNTIILMS